WAKWSNDPFSPIATLVQFAILIAGLLFSSQSVWPLAAALVLMIVIQGVKRHALTKRAREQGLPVGRPQL
ncbi:MAG TPA: hypothetical protein VEJ63_12340, partial [Planctomycetota bacterium]|nr:hypothetical protein [Planctomycetota bacterium]